MSTELPGITPHSHATPVARPGVVLPLPGSTANDAVVKPDSAAVADDGVPLSKAVDELNQYVASSRTDLRFAIDRDAGRLVVSIIDAESGQVLRQMPSIEALRIARYLEHDRLGLIRQQA